MEVFEVLTFRNLSICSDYLFEKTIQGVSLQIIHYCSAVWMTSRSGGSFGHLLAWKTHAVFHQDCVEVFADETSELMINFFLKFINA